MASIKFRVLLLFYLLALARDTSLVGEHADDADDHHDSDDAHWVGEDPDDHHVDLRENDEGHDGDDDEQARDGVCVHPDQGVVRPQNGLIE